MEEFLNCAGVWYVIQDGFEIGMQLTTIKYKESEKNQAYDQQIHCFIINKVDLDVYNKFIYAKTMKEMRIILINFNRDNNNVRKVKQ